jgi:hypothetical protein
VLASAPGRLKRLVADRGYDANHLQRDLRAARTNFASAIALAAVIAFWC